MPYVRRTQSIYEERNKLADELAQLRAELERVTRERRQWEESAKVQADKANKYAQLFGPLESDWNDVAWLRNQLVLANEHARQAEADLSGALHIIDVYYTEHCSHVDVDCPTCKWAARLRERRGR